MACRGRTSDRGCDARQLRQSEAPATKHDTEGWEDSNPVDSRGVWVTTLGRALRRRYTTAKLHRFKTPAVIKLRYRCVRELPAF